MIMAKGIQTPRPLASHTTLRFGLNAYHAACSIRLGLFALSLLRMLFAFTHRHIVQ